MMHMKTPKRMLAHVAEVKMNSFFVLVRLWLVGIFAFAVRAHCDGVNSTTGANLRASWIRDVESTIPSRFVFDVNGGGELVYAAECIVRDRGGKRAGKLLRLGKIDREGMDASLMTTPEEQYGERFSCDAPFPIGIIAGNNSYSIVIVDSQHRLAKIELSWGGEIIGTNWLSCDLKQYYASRPRYQTIKPVGGDGYAVAGVLASSVAGGGAYIGVCDAVGQVSWVDLYDGGKQNYVTSMHVEQGVVAVAVNSGEYDWMGGGADSTVNAAVYDRYGARLRKEAFRGRSGSVCSSGGDLYVVYDGGDGIALRRILLRRFGESSGGVKEWTVAAWSNVDVPGVFRVAVVAGGVLVVGVVPGENPDDVFEARLLVAHYSEDGLKWEWSTNARPPIGDSLQLALNGKRLYVSYETILPGSGRAGVRVAAIDLR
jgi:hypothetical protein